LVDCPETPSGGSGVAAVVAVAVAVAVAILLCFPNKVLVTARPVVVARVNRRASGAAPRPCIGRRKRERRRGGKREEGRRSSRGARTDNGAGAAMCGWVKDGDGSTVAQ